MKKYIIGFAVIVFAFICLAIWDQNREYTRATERVDYVLKYYDTCPMCGQHADSDYFDLNECIAYLEDLGYRVTGEP